MPTTRSSPDMTYDYRLESVDLQALPTYHGQITVEATANQVPQLEHRVFLPFVRH